jgi:hypothetical protein
MTYEHALRMVIEAARNTATRRAMMATGEYYDKLAAAIVIVERGRVGPL